MTSSSMTSRLSNSEPLQVVQDTPELSMQLSLDGSQRAKHVVGDGRMSEGLRMQSGAVKPELAPGRDGDEEFFDAVEYDGVHGSEKAPADPQTGAHSVGRDSFSRVDDVADDRSEVPSSPAESKLDPKGGGVPGEERSVKVGSGEKSAKVREEVQVQQGWMWPALQGAGRALGVAVLSIDSYFNPGLYGAGASGNSDFSGVPEPKGNGSDLPRASASAKTSAEKSEVRIRELTADIELAFAKLNQQLIEKYQMPELALARKAGSVDVPLTFWDNLGRMGHRMFGFGSAGISTVGQVGVAAAIPAVANALPVGITARIAAMAGGLWLGMRALADMPDQANAIAALKHVDTELAAVKPMLDTLKNLIEQERQREAGSGKTMMVSLERDQRINELERERRLLQNALASAESGGMEMSEFLEHPVALGNGESRVQMLNERQFGKSAFQSFFASIGEVLSSFIGFLSYLPSIFSTDTARREATRSEEAYLKAYRDAFSTLSSRAEDSGIDLLADPVTRMMQEGYGEDEIERRHQEVGAQLHRGENLQRLISGNGQVAFGQVMVASKVTPDIKTFVPASLSMARDMASYFSLMADKDADDQGFEVVPNEDGSLTVADPKGQLYSFLVSVPSAYTSGMAGVNGRGALASLTIDDHSAGFPGGARSMRFERALQLDSSGNPVVNEQGEFVSSLRVAFLADQPQPIYAPLANEGLALRSMAVRKHIAERKGVDSALTAIEAAAAKEYARMEPEELGKRLQQVTQDLERNRALLQVEQEQFKALRNWNAQP